MAKDKTEKEMEKLVARQRANKAASVAGGYSGAAVGAIRKQQAAQQREIDKILKGM